MKNISISIVSHGHGFMINEVLKDFDNLGLTNYEILLTINIKEDLNFLNSFQHLPIVLIQNKFPKGFGRNHNEAFAIAKGEIFIVSNPDIRIKKLDPEHIFYLFESNNSENKGIVSPLIFNLSGEFDQFSRPFPTFTSLLSRFFLQKIKRANSSINKIGVVDWVPGVFMIFKKDTFLKVGGFDTRYHMYMEDVDICRAVQRINLSVFVDFNISVVHTAMRQSNVNFKHFLWHFTSAIKYFIKHLFL